MFRRGVMCTGAVIAALGVIAPAASAGGTEPGDDRFTCRASALRVTSPIVNSEPIVSNKAGDPCADDSDLLASVTVPPLVKAGLVTTSTDNESDHATASAAVATATVTLGGTVITANLLQSSAAATCNAAGQAVLSGSSRVIGLTINGMPINIIDQPVTIPASPLVVVAINEQVVGPGTLTQRALRVTSQLLSTEVVIAESIADVHGNPCPAPPKPQCSDGIDNDGDKLVDADDPGCHTDGDPTNPGSYDPNDDDETDEAKKPQCSDEIDNDGDKLTDFPNDPGCSSAEDDDETDEKK